MSDDVRPRASSSTTTNVRFEVAPRTLLIVGCALALVWFASQVWNVILVVVVALVFVGTFAPMVSWLEHRGLRRGRAVAIICFGIAVALVAALLATVPALLAQLQHIIEDAPHDRDRIVAFFDQYAAGAPFARAVKSVPVDDLVVHAGNAVLAYSQDLVAGIGYAFTTAFLAIYLLVDPRRARLVVFQLVPRHHHVKLARILRELVVIVGGYMRGQLITSLAIGVFVFALMSLLGVDDALAIAVFASLTDVVPFIGGYLASGPAVFAVVGRGTATIVAVVVAMIVYQEFESRVLVPRVYGRVLRMSPATVLVAVLMGGALMGIIGALVALPIAATLRLLVRELRVELPGEQHSEGDQERESDARDEQRYEELAEGAPVAEAAQIADALARAQPLASDRSR